MIKALRKGDVGTTTKIDRLTRSMSDFFKLTEEIEEAIALIWSVLTRQSTPLIPHHLKYLLWQLLASIAEFERKLISSRVVKRVDQEQKRLANIWQTLHMKNYSPLKRVWVLIK